MISKVGFVVNPTIPAARSVAEEVTKILHAARVLTVECSNIMAPDVWARHDGLDMIFAFGGDGTILRSARVAAPLQVPILGINLGRVGFLREMGPDVVRERVPQVLAGNYWIERRSMLRAELWRDSHRIHAFDALNDVVASRAALSRVVDCKLMVNGEHMTTFVADGVILATPTGSTAYAMAAGGPIMHPEVRGILVTPIAPYLSIIRSLVLPEDSQIELDITTDDAAFLTVDGQTHVPLEDGDAIRITTSPVPALFARLQPRPYFAATLAQRLQRKD